MRKRTLRQRVQASFARDGRTASASCGHKRTSAQRGVTPAKMNAERPTRLRWSRALCRCPPWSREASPEIKKKRSGFDQGPVRVLAGCLSAHLLRKTALGSIEQAQRSTDTPARSQLTACACGNVTQRSFAGARPKRPPPRVAVAVRSVEVRPRAAQPKKRVARRTS